ncbi:MAG: DUF6134 family protein [Pseudomonadota bacterium]
MGSHFARKTPQVLSVLLAISVNAIAQAGENARPPAAVGLRRDFVVYLDDRRVGTHRFEILATDGKPAVVNSVARFDVKILGIRAYRYRHRAHEQWRDGCLTSLTATTDDNGARSAVDEQLSGCVMTYAYWRPDFLRQEQLLNPQTGKYDAIKAQSLGRETIRVGKVDLAADRYRVQTTGRSIDVWYSPQGEWLQLDATVAGGKTLRYRLP